MLIQFARLSTNHTRAVVIGAVVFVVAGVLGGGVADHLTSGGFEDPSSEPERADEAPAEHFGTGAPNSLLLVTAESGDIDDPLDCARRQALTDDLAGEGLSSEDGGALSVVAPDVRDAVPGLPNQIDAYATQPATLPAVTRVDAATGTYRGTGSATQLGCVHGKLVLPPRCSLRLAGFNVDGATNLSLIPWDAGGRQ